MENGNDNTYGEHGRRGAAQWAEEIWEKERQEEKDKGGKSQSLLVIVVEMLHGWASILTSQIPSDDS